MEIIDYLLKLPGHHSYVAQHGLGGVLFRSLQVDERGDFERSYLQTWHINQVYFKEYSTLKALALQAGIRCESLKGIYLLEHVYVDFGLRKMSDIDLLTDDVVGLQRLLTQIGYSIIDQTAYKVTLSKLVDGQEVAFELHQRLYRQQNIELDQSNGMLSSKEHLYYLIYHLSYQHTFLRLNWFLDIIYFNEKYSPNISEILSLAKQRGHLRAFKLTFEILNTFFNQNFDIASTLLPGWVDENFLLDPMKHKMKYYFLKHLAKENIYDALSYNYVWLKNKFR